MVSMSHTNVLFASKARKKLFKGLNTAAELVGCTLGPRGKTVIIKHGDGPPLVTKDGITVAKSIRLKDPIEQMGAHLVIEAANRTNEVAGDGTTTATILTQAMVTEGMKLLEAGYDALSLCRGIEHATKLITEELLRSAKKLTTTAELAQVGTISANGDTIVGDMIARAMDKVGRDGIITVEDAKGMVTTLDVVEGMQFDRGYLSPYFVTNHDRMTVTYQDAWVLVTDRKLSNLRELVPLLEAAMQSQKPLLIIADDVDGDALHGLVLNRVKSNLPVVAIKAPGFGQHRDELLRDICTLTGATLVSSSTGVTLEKATTAVMGRCKKVVVDAKSTTLVGSGATKDAIEKHVVDLRSQLEDVTLGADDIVKLRTRIAKLASGVAIIKVGGATEMEMNERKYRIEDALNATRAAAEVGIVPGGGMALISAKKKVLAGLTGGLDHGAVIVFKACEAPLRRIVSNCGKTPDVILNDLARECASYDNWGYDAATGANCDMIAAGVIDPVKVSVTALKHAASVAVTFLNLDAVICDDDGEGRGDEHEEHGS